MSTISTVVVVSQFYDIRKYFREVGEGVLLWASVTKNEISFFLLKEELNFELYLLGLKCCLWIQIPCGAAKLEIVSSGDKFSDKPFKNQEWNNSCIWHEAALWYADFSCILMNILGFIWVQVLKDEILTYY